MSHASSGSTSDLGPAPASERRGPPAPAVRLELAGPAHAAGMLAIYNREVESGTATFDMTPRSLEQQLEWVAGHSGAHPAVVALSTDDAGEDITATSAMVKAFTTEMYKGAVDAGLQVLGGTGYLRSSAMQRQYRDARLLTIGGGTTEVMFNVISRSLGL